MAVEVDDVKVTQPCAQCGAPLAEDQRYCLQCGEPRPDVRGPLSGGSLGAAPAQAPSSSTPQTPPSSPSLPGVPGASATRNNSLALIAGVGVLLLSMGVGVLIGRADSGSSKAAPAQVITVGGSGGGTTSTPTTTTPETPAESSKKKKEPTAKEAGTGASLNKKAAPPSTAKNVHSGLSGQSFEQRSKNLPNELET